MNEDVGLDGRGEGRFECSNRQCNEGVFYRVDDGTIVSTWEIRSSGGGSCESCQSSLSGAVMTDAWEDGGNSDAYVTCPRCGHHNIKYGYGGDD